MNKEQTKTNQEDGKLVKRPRSYLALTNRLLSFFIVAGAILQLAGINDLSIKYFVVFEKKQELAKLKEANRELETKAMSMSSYAAINKKLEGLKMVKVEKVDYLTASQPVVAKR
jgi:cell division protein FtsB